MQLIHHDSKMTSESFAMVRGKSGKGQVHLYSQGNLQSNSTC